MSAELKIAEDKDLNEIYNLLFQQIDGLLNKNEPKITNLSNITAALKQTFSKISWVGFYLLKDNLLYLGPFQGKVACTRIKSGQGVCGQSLERKESIIVEDVEKFPGHIYCDSDSRSEIVIPIISNGTPKGVLDLDSDSIGNFDETDRLYLEKLIENIKYLFENE